jgi:hypothetical protein
MSPTQIEEAQEVSVEWVFGIVQDVIKLDKNLP